MMRFTIIAMFFGTMLAQTTFREPVAKKQSFWAADTLKRDTETGLVMDENLYIVKAMCTNCHSTKLISANRFTRDGWRQKIRWMQANHNLWELGDAEKPVLDYLEKYYSPTESVARRAPLKDIKWYKLEQ